MSDFRQKSWWLESVDFTPSPQLEDDLSVDVAIVGGGFTGLSSAYYLKKAHPDLKIAILEAEVVGFGASGRNGGFAMTLIGKNIGSLRKKLGDRKARSAHMWARDAVDTVRGLVEEHSMDCDFEPTGMMTVSLDEKQDRRVREEVEDFRALGTPAEFLEGDALADHIASPAVRCAMVDPHCAILNPAKMVMGLKRVVSQRGVSIYEKSPALKIHPGKTVKIECEKGTVTAGSCVMATNAWSGHLGFFKSRVVPIFTYIVLTKPLSDAQYKSTGWVGREGIETANHLVHYFRFTADNRIAFGGQDAYYYFGNATDRDDHAIQFDTLRKDLVAMFPGLKGIEFERAWGGPVACSFDFFPTMGRLGENGNLYYSLAYNGHGVAPSIASGKVIADLFDRREEGYKDLFMIGHRSMPMGFEPIRWVGAQIYLEALRAADRGARNRLAQTI